MSGLASLVHQESHIPGQSKRVKVYQNKYNSYPYDCILFIRRVAKRINKQTNRTKPTDRTGTGFLISSCLVVTVAHNFYSINDDKLQIVQMKQLKLFTSNNLKNPIIPEEVYVCQKYISNLKEIHKLKKQITKINECPNLNQNEKQEKIRKIKKQFHKLVDQNCEYDYALVALSQPVQREKYFQINVPNINNNRISDERSWLRNFQQYILHLFIKPRRYTVCGFSQTGDSICQAENIIKIQGNVGYHIMHTEPGQSGSPVFDNNMQVIGIHRGYTEQKKMNTFVPISYQMVADIRQWRKCIHTAQYRKQFKQCGFNNILKTLRDISPEQKKQITELILINQETQFPIIQMNNFMKFKLMTIWSLAIYRFLPISKVKAMMFNEDIITFPIIIQQLDKFTSLEYLTVRCRYSIWHYSYLNFYANNWSDNLMRQIIQDRFTEQFSKLSWQEVKDKKDFCFNFIANQQTGKLINRLKGFIVGSIDQDE